VLVVVLSSWFLRHLRHLIYSPNQLLIPSLLSLLAALLVVVGLFDDRLNLPASWRHSVQLFTAAFLLGFSPLVQRFGFLLDGGNWFLLLLPAFLVIAVTAVINFINFMYGLDGLVAGCMAVAIAALSFVLNAPWSVWGRVGSLLGSFFGIGAPPRFSWGMLGVPFSVLYLLAWCYRLPVGRMRLATS
jgi:UDP-N-acetylmuramyl pentapeptide phosphotransferase/UDP-N-acetylglucosamine-1-phosphate transferase